MSTQLQNGVQLHVLPTDKYKTIRITIKFKAPLKRETITQRAMIANLLEISSKQYPTQTAFNSKLSELFGAGFGTGVTKKGSHHILTISLDIVNGKYLTISENLSEKAIHFLEQVVFFPNVNHDQFDEKTFKREKRKMEDEYEALYDDKQAYASLALQELLFDNKNQQVPSIGTKQDLEKITAQSLYHYYRAMIQEDEVDIYVMGSVNEREVIEYFKEFPFKARSSSKATPFYKGISTTDFHQKIEEQEVTQSKFNLGYATPIYYHNENYYAGQVFNGLFGGFPHSKLFMNVREKESLAYYASSSLDTFRGMMVVQTGINGKEADKVRNIIAEQLVEMQMGNFSDVAFLQTKSMLKNQLIQSEDNPGSVIERIYSGQLVSKDKITLGEWLKGIEETTKEEVIEVAKQIELKGIFFLSGGKNNGEN